MQKNSLLLWKILYCDLPNSWKEEKEKQGVPEWIKGNVGRKKGT